MLYNLYINVNQVHKIYVDKDQLIYSAATFAGGAWSITTSCTDDKNSYGKSSSWNIWNHFWRTTIIYAETFKT